MPKTLPTMVPMLALAAIACQQGGAGENAPPSDSRTAAGMVRDSDTQPFSDIAENELVRFTGTEPFWGGQIIGGEALYSTPDDPEGERFPVTRFAGNNGISFSGTLGDAPFDLMITPGTCSDGMSDRTYPFVATLAVGDEKRNGCAWTDRMSFTGPENP